MDKFYWFSSFKGSMICAIVLYISVMVIGGCIQPLHGQDNSVLYPWRAQAAFMSIVMLKGFKVVSQTGDIQFPTAGDLGLTELIPAEFKLYSFSELSPHKGWFEV